MCTRVRSVKISVQKISTRLRRAYFNDSLNAFIFSDVCCAVMLSAVMVTVYICMIIHMMRLMRVCRVSSDDKLSYAAFIFSGVLLG